VHAYDFLRCRRTVTTRLDNDQGPSENHSTVPLGTIVKTLRRSYIVFTQKAYELAHRAYHLSVAEPKATVKGTIERVERNWESMPAPSMGASTIERVAISSRTKAPLSGTSTIRQASPF